MTCLTWLADVSQVVTGTIAVVSAIWYLGFGYWRIVRLNRYLRAERSADQVNGKAGLRTASHLMARLGLSEEQLFRAAYWSCHVERSIRADDDGFANHIMFGYKA